VGTLDQFGISCAGGLAPQPGRAPQSQAIDVSIQPTREPAMTTTQQTATRIAIVGAGVSGLATAYYLQQRAERAGRLLDIHLFERKSTVGGNADTVVVKLGRYIGADGTASDFLRWADLGVNDANLATYTRMRELMADIGYDQMKPLQDTACYFSGDDDRPLTDDASLHFGVSDPDFSLTQADDGRLAPSSGDASGRTDLLGQITLDYTCARYFQDCLTTPRVLTAPLPTEHRDRLARPGPPARILTVRDRYYYPRISAMPPTTAARGMPLQAPFNYRLQEGGVTPDRRCFARCTDLAGSAGSLCARPQQRQVHITCTPGPASRWARQTVRVSLGRECRPRPRLCVLATRR
jgi:hypothetical protein